MDAKCTNCTGTDKCNKYCALQAGTNLVDFINGVDIIETQIGELREDSRTKKLGLIVSGHIIETSGAPTYVLSDLSTSIDISGKFISYKHLAPQQILRTYLDSLDISSEAKENTLKTFKLFNSNRLLPLPIKPGAECEIVYSDNTGKKTTISTKVSSVRWGSDKQTGKLNCFIHCIVDKGIFENNTRVVKIPIVEYGENIKLPQLERTLKSSEMDRDLIKMNSVGFIKPIVVTDDKFSLGVDNQHLYRITDTSVFIIGNWKNGKLVDFQGGTEPIQKSKAYKKIHNGMNYIEKHKRFIVPYGLFESNIIDLR